MNNVSIFQFKKTSWEQMESCSNNTKHWASTILAATKYIKHSEVYNKPGKKSEKIRLPTNQGDREKSSLSEICIEKEQMIRILHN